MTASGVSGDQRFRRGVSCPICGGSEEDDRGSGKRCFGFISGDGLYAHCTKEELAGGLPQNPNSQTFAHKLKGQCKCGREHGPAEPIKPRRVTKSRGPIEQEYDYRDESGTLLFQVVRYKSKAFIQRRPNGKGGWEWHLGDTRRVLYRLPELIGADPSLPVFVVEGEKDVDNLRAIGLVATCNPMGALKWRDEYSPFLAGRFVYLIGDNDKDGREHVRQVAGLLAGIAREIRVIDLAETCHRLGLGELPEKGDASDFLAMGGTAEQLLTTSAATTLTPTRKTAAKASATGGGSDSGEPNGEGATATATFADLGSRFPFGQQPGRNGRDSTPPGDGGTGDHHEFHLTDYGNAERLVSQHGADLRYCHPWKKWLVWDGCRWTIDNRGESKRRAKKTARAILIEAANEPDGDRRKQLFGHALATEKRKNLDAMLDVAESEPGIPIVPEDMIGSPWLFNCLNGTIDLRTGELRPHDRADHITQLCSVAFDPNATCPLWYSTINMFLRENVDIIKYIQMISGYAMTGIIRDQILPIAWGRGANGKSTIFDALVYTFGSDYAMNAPPDLLMAKQHEGHPTERADLFGKRLVVAMETEGGKRLNEARVKQLTSIAGIRARRMREDAWEFSPTHKLIMGTNHKPVIRGTDYAIWRRLKLVEFAVQIDESKADKRMGEKLRGERAGILAWCVRGCLDWQRSGLVEPAEVVEATAAYRAEQDVLGAFFDECTVQGGQFRVRADDLYTRFKEWAGTRNEAVMSQTDFGRAMTDRGMEKKKSGGNWYLGLALKKPLELY
jgi:putative DNA primase/helicase